MEEYFGDRFGIPCYILQRFHILLRGNTYFGLSRSSPGDKEPVLPFKVTYVGLPLLRRVGRYLKPTSPALRLFSPWITRNRILLPDDDAWNFITCGEIPLQQDLSEGYVLVQTQTMVIGCGLYLKGRLKSQLPTSELMSLKELINRNARAGYEPLPSDIESS